jgi:hypothetical protein
MCLQEAPIWWKDAAEPATRRDPFLPTEKNGTQEVRGTEHTHEKTER